MLLVDQDMVIVGTKLYEQVDNLFLYVLQISKVYWTISIQDLPPDNAFQ